MDDVETPTRDFRTYRNRLTIIARQMLTHFEVVTKNGVQKGKAGDYLCIDIQANQYIVPKEEFERTYVETDEPF